MKVKELKEMTRQQLCDYCRKYHIKGYSGKTKQQRVDLILKHHGNILVKKGFVVIDEPETKPKTTKQETSDILVKRILTVIANSSKEVSEEEIRKKLNRKSSIEKEIKYLSSKKLINTPAQSRGVYYYYVNDKAIPLIRTKLNKKNKEIVKDLDKLPTALKPKTLFHVTKKQYVSSILKKGIVPSIKQTSEYVSIDKVYLTDRKGVDNILDQSDIKIHSCDVAVMEVDTNGLDFYYDPEFYGNYDDNKINILKGIKNDVDNLYVYTKKVPKSNIIGTRKVKFTPWKYGVYANII